MKRAQGLISLCLIASMGAQDRATRKAGILLLQPEMAFSDYRTDATIPPDRYGGSVYGDRLRKEAAAQFARLDFQVVDTASLSDPAAREAATRLQTNSSTLSRGLISAAVLDLLATVVSATDSPQFLFVQNMKVKLGPHGAWTPEDGLLGPQMTTTFIQAALISCSGGRLIWQGQAFRRDLPGVSSRKFDGMIKDLYRDIKIGVR